MLERDFNSFASHINAYNYFTTAVLESACHSVPKTVGIPRCPAVPWCDRQCSVLRKVTRKCFRRYRNSGSQQSKLIYKRALAKQRNYYKKAKRDSWLHYINGINSKTSLALVWKKVQKLSGKFVPHPVPNLKIGD